MKKLLLVVIPTIALLTGCDRTISKARGGACELEMATSFFKSYQRAHAVSFENDKIVSLMTDEEKEAAKTAPPAPGRFESKDPITQQMGEKITEACTKQVIPSTASRIETKFAYAGENCPVKAENGTLTTLDAEGKKVTATENFFYYEVLKNDFAALNDVVQFRYAQAETDVEKVGEEYLSITREGHIYSPTLGQIKLRERILNKKADDIITEHSWELNFGNCKSTVRQNGDKTTIDDREVTL